MLIKSVSYFLIVMASLVEVNCQVCVTQRSYRSYSSTEGYWFTRAHWKEDKKCCHGYIKKNYYSEASQENCVPTCYPDCKNGYCKSPDVCACNTGYTMRNNVCEPFCCLHGSCVGNTNACQCDDGYNLVNNTCTPVCTENCENGICTAPEKCECNPGYIKPMRKRRWNLTPPSCIPICPGGCPISGYCSAPGICKCHEGWHLSENRCEALCKYPCGNGTCIFPDQCLCNPGYRNSFAFEGRQVCAAVCNDCEGSSCVAPNTCINEPTSWSSDEESTSISDPYNTMTPSSYYTDRDESASKTSAVSYSESSSATDITFDDDVYTSVTVELAGTNISVTSTEKSWMFICIPIIVIVTAGLILLLVRRRIPRIIINLFRRRSYNVHGAVLNRNCSNQNGSDSYESIHFITAERH